ncbi:hypothetical protein EVAR_17730_1 [Eumeta japonica]|uniref:Uncharacterized protein n=1 Tax=Eumeta variegata TaxID=151549 RepID=A0A4C1TT85_EUMVA|nr:hypothetical protein EVAR_17730_1 [Eumeta japonica]
MSFDLNHNRHIRFPAKRSGVKPITAFPEAMIRRSREMTQDFDDHRPEIGGCCGARADPSAPPPAYGTRKDPTPPAAARPLRGAGYARGR